MSIVNNCSVVEGYDETEMEEIYRGSFADAYKVNARIQQSTGTVCDRLIAAKFLKFSVPRSNSELHEFLKQNMDLRSLCHENLVNILDIQIQFDKNTIAFFMDLFEGQHLRKFIEKHPLKALDEIDIKHISKQICSALMYLHNKDIHVRVVHRNINSKTVLIDEERFVRLVDYGLSVNLLDATSHHSHSRGHPRYMAPEVFLLENPDQADGGSIYSRGSDIWAFGCVVYEMASGKKPYKDCGNMLAIVRKVKEGNPPELPANCSVDLKSFYTGCMARDKRERTRAADLLKHPFLA